MTECIYFLESVISELTESTEEKQRHYREAIDKIKRRASDENLNVAVIGNFSTGKSTFINGFIKRKLLKTAHTATTAVPTRIYCHKKEASDVITVSCRDGEKYELGKTESREALEKRLGAKLPDGSRDVIAALSTSNDYLNIIDELILNVSSFNELSGICIMDTPGVNPGDEAAKEHIRLTQDILRKKADAAIILLPAHQVIGASFNNFLEENASHFLDDSIFVITMMDVLNDEEERREVIEFASDVIKNKFGLSELRLYTCSAIYAEPENKLDDKEGWNEKFDELRKNIIDHMYGRRERIIEAQLAKLLEQLIDELKSEVRSSTERIQLQLKNLEENSTERLDEIIERNYSKYSAELDDRWRGFEFEKQYDELYDRVIVEARGNINCCTKIRGSSGFSVSGYVNNVFPFMLRTRLDSFKENIRMNIASTEDLLKEYCCENERVLNRFSLTVGSLSEGGEESENDTEQKQEAAALTAYNDSGVVENLTVLAGTVATLPFAVLDGLLGTDMSGAIMGTLESVTGGFINAVGNLNNKKVKAISHIESIMNEQRKNGREAFLTFVSEQEKSIFDSMKRMKEEFSQSYTKVYAQSSESIYEKQRAMKERIEKNEMTLNKLEQYLEAAIGGKA